VAIRWLPTFTRRPPPPDLEWAARSADRHGKRRFRRCGVGNRLSLVGARPVRLTIAVSAETALSAAERLITFIASWAIKIASG
jgi:hypothetical protein